MRKSLFLFASAVILCWSLSAGSAESPLPAGVREITTAELKALFDRKEKYVLIITRYFTREFLKIFGLCLGSFIMP